MNEQERKERIDEERRAAGTDHPAFDSTAQLLAEILAQRDNTREEFLASGGNTCVLHTLDRGAQNLKLHPALKAWTDLNGQALNFLSALGLTAKNLARLPAEETPNAFETMLADLGI